MFIPDLDDGKRFARIYSCLWGGGGLRVGGFGGGGAEVVFRNVLYRRLGTEKIIERVLQVIWHILGIARDWV
jgi:hypothetical protein